MKAKKMLGDVLARLPVIGSNDWDTGVVNLQQAKLTKVLYQKTQETNLVTVHFGSELIAIEQDSTSVTALVTNLDGAHKTFNG